MHTLKQEEPPPRTHTRKQQHHTQTNSSYIHAGTHTSNPAQRPPTPHPSLSAPLQPKLHPRGRLVRPRWLWCTEQPPPQPDSSGLGGCRYEAGPVPSVAACRGRALAPSGPRRRRRLETVVRALQMVNSALRSCDAAAETSARCIGPALRPVAPDTLAGQRAALLVAGRRRRVSVGAACRRQPATQVGAGLPDVGRHLPRTQFGRRGVRRSLGRPQRIRQGRGSPSALIVASRSDVRCLPLDQISLYPFLPPCKQPNPASCVFGVGRYPSVGGVAIQRKDVGSFPPRVRRKLARHNALQKYGSAGPQSSGIPASF